jgi:hypothetical protein
MAYTPALRKDGRLIEPAPIVDADMRFVRREILGLR